MFPGLGPVTAFYGTEPGQSLHLKFDVTNLAPNNPVAVSMNLKKMTHVNAQNVVLTCSIHDNSGGSGPATYTAPSTAAIGGGSPIATHTFDIALVGPAVFEPGTTQYVPCHCGPSDQCRGTVDILVVPTVPGNSLGLGKRHAVEIQWDGTQLTETLLR